MFEKFVHEDPLQAGEHCMLINKLVLSKSFYCSSVWSNAADTDLLKLQAVQNFAARIICVSRKFDHVLILPERTALATYYISVTSCLLLSITRNS